MDNIKRILFFQPALPIYRLSFFKKLSELLPFELNVLASRVDTLEVNSVNYDKLTIVGDFLKIGPFLWQKGIPLFDVDKKDIIVISGNIRIINYMLLFVLCKIRNIKVIWWGQGWTAGKRTLFSLLRRKIMLFADGIAVYTHKEANNIKHKNIVGLNNGIDLNEIKLDTFEDMPSDILTLFFIGRLTEKSNILFLLKALSKLERTYHLNIIGDGILENAVINFINDNNMNDFVTLHGSISDNEKIIKISKRCDFFIYTGSVGLSLIHAFALSLPAIIHDNSFEHMPEFAAFENGINGISFKYNDLDDLISVLNTIDKHNSKELSKSARLTVERTFNSDDMALRFLSIVNRLF
ncbi:TPA: glycosyltransferase family 4 protein [Photobacterium damselae]